MQISKILVTIGVLLSACFIEKSSAQQAGASRVEIRFNDNWQFRKDETRRDIALSEGKYTLVQIPHTWNSRDIQLGKGFYAGDAFYKRELFAETAWKEKRVFIRFEGVGSVAQLYVNDKFIGQHKGSYSAFAFELSYALEYGKNNTIEVRVNNQEREDVIPVNNRLFPVYGGIYRPVSLIITNKVNFTVTDYASPGIYIKQKKVTADLAEIQVMAKLENRFQQSRMLTFSTCVYDESKKLVKQVEEKITVKPQGMQVFSTNFTLVKPHLWQALNDPYLYRVVTRIKDADSILDEVTQPIGIRKFEIKPGGFYLNDKPYRLYGVCRHQDFWEKGNALSNEQHAQDLNMIREIGATSIRFAHYQQAEYLYSRCDSMGFVIWAEIPFVNAVSGKESDNAKQQLTELIRQNYNHPSIYVWGVHNEVYGKTPGDYAAVLTRELNDIVKTEDPDRYSVSVSGYGEMNRPTNLNTDIQGMNRYYGWYEGKTPDLEGWVKGLEEQFPGHVVMLAEYGAEANIDQNQEVLGNRVPLSNGQFFPENYQTRLHEIQWGIIEKHPYLKASYVWNMFDFAVPLWSNGSVPARNMKGLVTFDRKQKKDAFYWYKANWNKDPMIYISDRRMVKRSQPVTNITVYCNIDSPVLFVNGEKITAVKQGATRVHYIFENVKLQKGLNKIKAVAYYNHKPMEDTVEWSLEE
jgi:beta-galactosidase